MYLRRAFCDASLLLKRELIPSLIEGFFKRFRMAPLIILNFNVVWFYWKWYNVHYLYGVIYAEK